jgi:branched-subunit amino acid transport protein
VDLITRAWLVIVLGGVATYLIRASFLLAARRLATVPDWARDVLRMIPAAALAALVAPALLRPETTLQPFGPQALAGALALAVAWWTRNVLLTIVVGVVAVMGFDYLLG